jgi:hypothetical protein
MPRELPHSHSPPKKKEDKGARIGKIIMNRGYHLNLGQNWKIKCLVIVLLLLLLLRLLERQNPGGERENSPTKTADSSAASFLPVLFAEIKSCRTFSSKTDIYALA